MKPSSVAEAERLASSLLRSRNARRRSGASGPATGTEIRLEKGRTVISGDIPVDLPIEPGQVFLFLSRDQSAFTHGLHKYPAKFFPELPRFLIQRYSRRGARVLDPFAGSGTTNVEAMLMGRPSTAVDVDPFSRFLIRTKVTCLPLGLASHAALLCVDAALGHGTGRRSQPRPPEFPYRDVWFSGHALDELAYLKREIMALPGKLAGKWSESELAGARDLMLVAFSSVIRESSNADNNCTRTVVRKSLGKKVPPGLTLRLFARKAVASALGMEELARKRGAFAGVTIPEGSDARSIQAPARHFSLAVTSPPYCNAVDYPRTHQLEMYWLGLASGSLAPLKRAHVGTEVVSARDYGRLHETGVPGADEVIRHIFRTDPRRAYILFHYLDDMERNLVEVRRVLKPGGRYCVAVGNNVIRGRAVENWRYIAALGERAGFETETSFGSQIIHHFIKVPRPERIDTDFVVVLRRP